MSSLRAVLAVAGALLVLSACDGGGDEVDADAAPCSLLERGEVERAFGKPVAKGEEGQTDGNDHCTWRAEDGTEYVRVAVLDVPDTDVYFDNATDAEPIDDLGERAYVGPVGDVTVEIDDRTILRLDAVDFDLEPDELAELGEELARKAVSRL